MKLSSTRRALLLANVFNLLVAIYFIIIAIVGLAQLRWYHQLTVSVRAHYFITLATSYFAFFLLILVGLILIGLFVSSSLTLASAKQSEVISTDEDAINTTLADISHNITGGGEHNNEHPTNNSNNKSEQQQQLQQQQQRQEDAQVERLSPVSPLRRTGSPGNQSRVIVLRQSSLSAESNASACCSILLYLIVSIGLIAILVFWLFNTGELVRDNISTQLDYALARYQFTNRSNRFSIAIDGLQDSNNCCGSLDYTDFPHGRMANLPPGHYPGSCCGKNIFGVNARVLCMADEVWRARQTSGCTTVLANYYDLLSILIVPVALVCLFVNITIIALITISKGGGDGRISSRPTSGATSGDFTGAAGGGGNLRDHQRRPRH